MNIDTAYVSEEGGRDVNQDDGAYIQESDRGGWVIADGLGGHKGGEVASALAVEAALDSFRAESGLDPDTIKGHVAAAHQAVREKQEDRPKYSSMRTTIVALFRDGEEVRWAHVGDARLYHFRGGGIRFQTKDHSVPQTMVAAGDISSNEIRFHEDRGRLLRALGQDGEVRTEVAPNLTFLKAGDAFLLCTDGFWEYVTEPHMEVALAQSGTAVEWLDRMERVLRRRAEGKHDNYSAMGVIFEEEKE